MLNANVLATMMQAAVAAAIPETALLDDQFAGGKSAFFKAIASAVVAHIQTSGDVIVPPHVTLPVTGGLGFGDGGIHEVGKVL